MTHEEWLAERKKGIGGSDAAAVLNEGYGCARALYYDKTGVPIDFIHSEATERNFERGNVLEDLVADLYTKKTGRKIRRQSARISKTHPWMRVNMDRQILNDERGPGYLECKTANKFVFANMKAEGMPPHYVIQLQHGLAVTGYEWGAFAALHPDTFEFLTFEMRRDEDLIAVLIAWEEEFWNMRVGTKTVPDALEFGDKRCRSCQWRRTCRGDAALLQAAGKDVASTSYEEDDALAPLVSAFQTAQFDADDKQALADALKDKIKELLGDRQAVSVPSAGARILYKQQAGRSTWDGRALDTEHPELAAKYKKVTAPSRPFKVITL